MEPVLFTEEELDELVAPVALYPDALLAQVLVAATFPLQVGEADQLIEDSDELSRGRARRAAASRRTGIRACWC